MVMNAFCEARDFFSDMPEEVFILWLDVRIRTNGWPPSGVEWQGFLFGHTIQFWQNLTWSRERVFISESRLAEKSAALVDQVIEANLLECFNKIAQYVPDTKQRFASIVDYIKVNRDLPKPIVLLDVCGRFEVIDGCHRISAYTALRKIPEGAALLPETIDAWVARPPSNIVLTLLSTGSSAILR